MQLEFCINEKRPQKGPKRPNRPDRGQNEVKIGHKRDPKKGQKRAPKI